MINIRQRLYMCLKYIFLEALQQKVALNAKYPYAIIQHWLWPFLPSFFHTLDEFFYCCLLTNIM